MEDFMSLSRTVSAEGLNLFLRTSEAASKVWKGFKAMASDSKAPRLVKKIGTHSGVFHCDEALACYMLKQLPEYEEAEIVRSREMNVLDECDLVVDVGAIYNPKKHRYDHHQRGFNETLSSVRPDLTKNKAIPLSSAGLIYAHFGFEVLSEVLKKRSFLATSDSLRCIFLHIYDIFIEEMDAVDNGVPICADGKPKFRINTHLSARVHRLNPEWNSIDIDSSDKLFEKAMKLVGNEFEETVFHAASVWWPAREIVRKALQDRNSVHSSGEVIFLNGRCPWKDHLLPLEEELGISGEVKFCIFQDLSTKTWRVQGIPIQPDSFICRVFLHNDWRGVRDDELSSIAGIEDCVFCHSTGFIGGNKTKEGALQMALKSLEACRE